MSGRLERALKECGALIYGSFTLSSGKESAYYIDIKSASTDPGVLRLIAREMADLLRGERMECERLAGVVLGSVPLAVALSLETGIPYVMVRKGKRDHGTGREIEGPLRPGDRVVVVEDVVTSAQSLAEAVATLRAAGAVVEKVIAVVDREGGGRERLEKLGLEFFPLLTASQLLEGGDGV